MDLRMLKQVEPCPRCGELSGWYERRVCKYIQLFEVDGTAVDASNMERVRGGEHRYCASCHKDITDQIKKAD